MGLLYFEVEADYKQLIELRKQIDELETQMAEVGKDSAKALEPLEKKYAELISLQDALVSKAAVSGQKLKETFSQMEKVNTGLKNTTSITPVTTKAQKTISAGKTLAQGFQEADSAAQVFGDTLGGVNQGLGKVLNMMNGLGPAVGTAFGVGAIGMFINKVQEVRTYFQDIESSMKVFLGDAEKADKFTSELKKYAFYNMFEFSDLAGGAKQLIAYGNETEKIIPIMDRLSNVASGTGASLGELIALYNKAKSTGQVMARDVQSWAAKGVVLRDELKAMGVEASSGAVTFTQLNQVLERVTGEGGRFHNLMREQMNNLSAAKGQFQDELDAMYNEIGEKLQPVLKGTIDIATWLAENYEMVGKTVLTLCSTYGIYRVILGVTNALDKQRVTQMKALLMVANGEAKSIGEATSMLSGENNERMENVAAIKAEIEAKKDKIAVDIAEEKANAKKIRKRLRNIKSELDELDKEHPGLQQKAAQIGNSQGKRALAENEKKYNILLSEQTDLKEKLKTANDSVAKSEELLTTLGKEDIVVTKGMTLAKKKLGQALKPLGTLLSSPYFWAAAAITAALVATYNLITAETVEEKATRKVTELQEEYNAQTEKRISQSNSLINTIKDETKSLYEQANAYERLIEMYPDLKKLTKNEIKEMEFDKLQSLINEIESDQAVEYYKDTISSLEAKIKHLEDLQQQIEANPNKIIRSDVSTTSFDLGKMFPSLFKADRWNTLDTQIEEAKAELAELNKQEEKRFKEQERKKVMSTLSSKEKIEVLKAERDNVVANQDTYDRLYQNLQAFRNEETGEVDAQKTKEYELLEVKRKNLIEQKELAEQAVKTAEQARDASMRFDSTGDVIYDEKAQAQFDAAQANLTEATDAWNDFNKAYNGFFESAERNPELFYMFQAVKPEIDEVEKKITTLRETLKGKEGKEKLMIEAEIESSESLLDKLKKVQDTLQGYLDKTPLQIAFDEYDPKEIEGWGDMKAAQKRTIRKFIRERNKIIESEVSDEDKTNQLDALYFKYIQDLKDKLGDDDTAKSYVALNKFIRQLGDDRREGVAIMREGVVNAVNKITKEGAEASSVEVRQAEDEYNKAIKGQGNLWKKIEATKKSLEESRKTMLDLERIYTSGSGEVKDEELKIARETYNQNLASYNELIKQANKYAGQIEANRKRLIKIEREHIDRQFSVREKEISLMRDGADKSIAQTRLEFEKRQEEIKRGYDDIKETRMQQAKEAFNAQALKEGEFSEAQFLANYETDYADEIAQDMVLKNAQEEANVMDFIRKMTDLSKDYQTEAEKKAEERRKKEEDIKAIDESIAEIRAKMTDATREEGEWAIRNLEERKKLAESIRDSLYFNQEMNDYLLNYGSAFMQKQAVNAKYDNLVSQEQNEWKRKGLEEQRSSELSKIDLDAMTKSIDWAGALEDLGGEFADYARQIYDKAYAYAQSDEFRSKSAEEQQAFLGMLAKVRENIPLSIADLNFVALGKTLNKYRDATEKAVQADKDRVEAERNYLNVLDMLNVTSIDSLEAQLAQQEAERDELLAKESLTDEEKTRLYSLFAQTEKTSNSLGIARTALNKLTVATNDAEQAQVDAREAQGEASDSIQKATMTLQNWAGGLKTLLSADSLSDIFSGLSQFISNLGGKWSGIIGAVLSIADTLIGTFAGDDWMLSENQKNFKRLAESTDDYIDAQTRAIDILRGYTSEQTTTEKAETYDEMYNRAVDRVDRKREEAFASLTAQTNSNWDKFWNGQRTVVTEAFDSLYDKNLLRDFFSIVDKETDRYIDRDDLINALSYSVDSNVQMIKLASKLGGLFEMEGDELKRFQVDYYDLFAVLPDEIKQYLQAIIDLSQEANDILEEKKANIMRITFDDMYSSFVNKMMDMKTTAYDTAGDISEMFYKAMVQNRFDNVYKKKIEKLYEDMSEDLAKGDPTEEQMKNWREEYNKIVSDALKERETLAKVTGYDQTYEANQASSRGFQAMSQDVGNELNGRFTSLQISGEQIKGYQQIQTESLLPALSAKIDTLVGLIGGDTANPLSHIISDVQTTLNESYLELQAINANTAAVMDYWAKKGELRQILETIRNNTNKIK